MRLKGEELRSVFLCCLELYNLHFQHILLVLKLSNQASINDRVYIFCGRTENCTQVFNQKTAREKLLEKTVYRFKWI
jgi:hypothetical protein